MDKLPTIADFYTFRHIDIYTKDGSKHRVLLRELRSGEPVYVQDNMEHSEDWHWAYPKKGDAEQIGGLRGVYKRHLVNPVTPAEYLAARIAR